MAAATVLDQSGEPNPYLLGVYAPVHEEITAGDLTVVGEIPRDLNGVYLRNGPNARHPAHGRYHWFDGDGMVHAMHFENGTARYRNRYVRTRAFDAESAAGRSLWTGVMENPKGNPFGNSRGINLKDSANTDLIFHRGKVLATWYLCGSPYALDPLSLETLGAETFLDTLTGDFMAHPKADERTGELFWFDYGPRPPYLRYGVVGAGGTVEHLVEIDLPGARLPHDMAITENHAVLMDLPLFQDQDAARHGRYKLTFDRGLPSRFGVIPRRGAAGDVRWFEAKPCYIYHVVNAWESGDEIVMDVCRVSRPAPSGSGSPLSRMLSYLKLDARLYRYRFDLRTGRTSEGFVDEEQNTEFPSIDTRRTGYATRYAYNVTVKKADTNLFDGIVRYDNVTGERQHHRFGEHRYGSEAPFAPRDGATGEDDGYLVTFVTDEREGTSEVQILSAADLTAGPLARVLLPRRVPLGFHATWVRADQLR
ncbi:carotenoid cleavage dioxygenase [Sphaerisporangium siamense]|uniref:Dioxygenase n=1 Tax=Sphaerisporangium siamense TaxID=795645 RepID=A0A7W7DGX6_9ACTN|nr:carotenoid oxygenase family protein [Sphaerisporangium siamense]MBB4705770.1 carotenoid cleavage dioxygenase [Sphaerisporangium siamense]GII82843.1 carotenoid cleavage dioxygenase [Sphaerisporangium siamense]